MKYLVIIFTSFFLSVSYGRDLGIGIVLGSEGPITGKFYLNPSRSLQFHFGSDEGLVEFHADYLWEKQKAFRVEGQNINFYAGVGAAIVGDEENERGRKERDTYVGPRVPLGLNMYLVGNQLEVFTEIVPGVLVAPETETFIAFGLGARWFFK